MRIFGFEIKRQRRPNLSRDVIPEMQGLIESISQGMIALTAQVDQNRKDIESTRRKVYRDNVDGMPPVLDAEKNQVPDLINRDNGHEREVRTGDPA